MAKIEHKFFKENVRNQLYKASKKIQYNRANMTNELLLKILFMFTYFAHFYPFFPGIPT
jgi:hypothetical protein